MRNGLTFKGIHSSTYDIVTKSVNRQLLPGVTRFTQQVPGMHGVIDYGNDTYGEKTISTLLQHNYNHKMSNLMEWAEQVVAWLYDDGEYHDLIFDDQPTRVYHAKIAANIDLSPDHSLAALQVVFTCNPPNPFVNGVELTPEEIIWNTAAKDGNQYMQEFTANGHMRFTNIGTLPVKPKITLLNNVPAGTAITYNGSTLTYTALSQYDSVIIDCESETVTRGSDGANLYSNITGSYFEFAPGQINLDIVATGIGVWPANLIVLVEFTPQEVG